MGIDIIHGNAVQWAQEYTGPKFHAMLCDPPYHLTSIVKRFGGSNAAPAQHGTDGAFARASRGFMGKQWDGGDIAFNPETWATFGELLYPGAFGMAFASSRGWHRLAVAIEDAGFIIHPSIFGWAYGSGFPKATRVDTQIDKHAPHKHLFAEFAKHYAKQRDAKGFTHNQICGVGKFYGEHNHGGASCNWESGANVPTLAQWKILQPLLDLSMDYLPLIERVEAERQVIGKHESDFNFAPGQNNYIGDGNNITAPATDLARAFAGYRYGLQALKPALEPIIVFQKPYEGRPIDNITQYGCGVLNIDGGRIATDEPWEARDATGLATGKFFTVGETPVIHKEPHAQGRWPSNFILLDDEAASALDRQSGASESVKSKRGGNVNSGTERYQWNVGEKDSFDKDNAYECGYDDAGGASRFFFRVQDAIDAADPVYYCAKASTEERDAGIDSGVILPNAGKRTMSGGEDTRGRPEAEVRNPHPTVKPIALARYLATLLLPPTEYAPRRLFIPFAGVASECIGSMQAGWDEITGVELTEEYIPIAQARVEYWRARGWQLSMFSEILTQENANV